MDQKFTHNKLTVPVNSLGNSIKLCHGFRKLGSHQSKLHHMSQLEVNLWKYFEVAVSVVIVFANPLSAVTWSTGMDHFLCSALAGADTRY